MRVIIFFIVIAVFCLPVLANQEDVLSFTYVTSPAHAPYQYDLFVMDARSGETLYSIVGEDYDCPYSISEDNNWLLYSQNSDSRLDADNFLLNLNTGENHQIGVSRAWELMGNHDFSQIASIQWDDRNWDARLAMYERSTGYTNILSEYEGDDVDLIRFVGDDLLFVMLEENEIIFNRWDGTLVETRSFSRLDSDNISLVMSPDGNFLKILYHHDELETILSIIDTTSGDVQDIILPRLGILYELKWMPGSNSFAYVAEDGGVWFYDAVLGEAQVLLAKEETAWYSNLLWSPDASYLLLNQNLEGSHLNLKLVDMSSGAVSNIFTGGNLWNIEWLSTTEFVYDFSEDRFTTDFDIVYYDASRGEMRQLTDTDDFDESLYCGWG